jgi:ATP-dependent phosphofructokinase / diphosphate-dependent phosphofructokinase
MKKIGILTSGGDCPGLNAVIRAVVKCATAKGEDWHVYGIPYGTDGFMQLAEGKSKPDDFLLTKHGFDIPGSLRGLEVLQFLSGTILGSVSRGKAEDQATEEKILKGYEILGLDALIAIGGDGSLDIIHEFAQKGKWNLVAIPKTIDNDVPSTRSVGFDTAVHTVTKAIYDLSFTAASHERVMIVEVMGRDAGHLALYSGIAGGADIILIPEITPKLSPKIINKCCEHIAKLREEKRMFALVVIAEGVKNEQGEKERYTGDYLAKKIKEQSQMLCHTGSDKYCDLDQVDTRVTVLGHLQRTATPTSFDIILGTTFGIKAVELIELEKYNQLVVWRNGQVETEPLDQIVPKLKNIRLNKGCASPVDVNGVMVQTARSLGLYVGD